MTETRFHSTATPGSQQANQELANYMNDVITTVRRQVGLRAGEVISHATGRATITLGGEAAQIQAVPYLAHVSPYVGAKVWVAEFNDQLLIVGIQKYVGAGALPGEVFWHWSDNTTLPGALLCYGQTIENCDSIYPGLWEYSPASAKSGTSLTLPDLRGRTIMGLDNMGGVDAGRIGTANTIGTTGGTNTISEAMLPSHSHGLNSHTHSTPAHSHAFGTLAVSSHSHDAGTYSISSHTHSTGTYAVGSHSHDAGTLAGDSHSHTDGTLAAASHSHTDGTLTVDSHSHGVGTLAGGSHSHSADGTLAVASHSHSFSATTSTSADHTHGQDGVHPSSDEAGGYGLTVSAAFQDRVAINDGLILTSSTGSHSHSVSGTSGNASPDVTGNTSSTGVSISGSTASASPGITGSTGSTGADVTGSTGSSGTGVSGTTGSTSPLFSGSSGSTQPTISGSSGSTQPTVSGSTASDGSGTSGAATGNTATTGSGSEFLPPHMVLNGFIRI